MKYLVLAITLAQLLAVNSAQAGAPYHCSIFDPAIGHQRADKNVIAINGKDNAIYHGKNTTLRFEFGSPSIKVTARDAKNDDRIYKFSNTTATHDKFHGYIKDLEIEVNCRKQSR